MRTQVPSNKARTNVLYSFPHRIGAGRICNTAWQQVNALCNAEVNVHLLTGSIARPLKGLFMVRKTLQIGRVRIPVRIFGRRVVCDLHDYLTSRWLTRNSSNIDAVHCWPLASKRTLETARKLNIPSFLERPNAHTAYAFDEVEKENRIIGIELPAGHDHERNEKTLNTEELEYELADYLLCPSDFVKSTYLQKGYPQCKLLRHQYGYDPKLFFEENDETHNDNTINAIYVGVCEPRKGLHYALDAWISSKASQSGRFKICGSFVPHYREKLSRYLEHPSVEYLGHRSDVNELLRKANVFILSSVEEGSALVTYEAKASGCVLLVSTSTGALARHKTDSLIHEPRNVEELRTHIDYLYDNPTELIRLKNASKESSITLTWKDAGERLLSLYRNALNQTGDTGKA